jgi:hypothetical protein
MSGADEGVRRELDRVEARRATALGCAIDLINEMIKSPNFTYDTPGGAIDDATTVAEMFDRFLATGEAQKVSK